MTISRYLLGVLLFAVAVVPVAGAAWSLRRRFLPEWNGSLARLIEVVLATSITIVVLETLGVVHLYRTAPVVIAMSATGAVIRRWANRTGERQERTAPVAVPRPRVSRAMKFVTVGTCAVLLGSWIARTADGLRNGMQTVDSLWYHMPVAARFVQAEWIGSLHYVDSEPVTAFFPANSPLLHSLGILLFGSDLPSPFMNLAWLALALFAGWCIGRPFGVGPATLIGTALVLATPGMVATQPGGAYTDVVGLALLLVAVAILVHMRQDESLQSVAALAVAALAAGLAIGTKFTFIVPVGTLMLAAIWLTPRAQRKTGAAVWLIALTATGSLWYVRNLFVTGNPLPELSIGVGQFALPTTTGRSQSFTVAQYLFDARIWKEYFVPGLNLSLGPAWFVLVGASLAGLLLALVYGSRLQRALGFVGVASLVAFLVTPQFLGLPDAPVFFSRNVRYASFAFVLGLVVLPTLPVLTRCAPARIVLVVYCGVFVMTQLDATIWPLNLRHGRFEEPVRGAASIAGVVGAVVILVGGAALVMQPRFRQMLKDRRFLLALFPAVILAGAGVHSMYLADRYTDTRPAPTIYAWAREMSNARIGVIGPYLQLQYPLYGKDLSNHVQFVVIRGEHGAVAPASNCRAWKRAVSDGAYDYVVISAERERAWTEADPATHTLAVRDRFSDPLSGAEIGVSVHRLDGPMSAQGCAAGA